MARELGGERKMSQREFERSVQKTEEVLRLRDISRRNTSTDGNHASIGSSFLHCAKCLAELPSGESPKSWARQQASISRDGRIQIWCTRHDVNIAVVPLLTFTGVDQ